MTTATRLPINVVTNTNPPVFRWQSTVSTIGGTGHAVQDCEGMLPPSVESAVVQLIDIAKRLAADNAELHVKMAKQIDVINELIDRNTNKEEVPPSPAQPKQNIAPQVTPLRKGK